MWLSKAWGPLALPRKLQHRSLVWPRTGDGLTLPLRRRRGDHVAGTSPVFIRQLLPAVVLAAAGSLVLAQFSQPGPTPAMASLGDTPVNAEAVFTSTPRAPAEDTRSSAAPRAVHKARPAGSNAVPSRKPETAIEPQQAATGAPLPITPSPEQIQAAAPNDTGIMGTLRSVGTTVQEMPQRAYSRVTGWFSPHAPAQPDMPPRPPADIPQNKAEM